MSKLYSAETTIVWNGNVVKGGSEKVTEFFNSLPATEHTLHSLDCQPVSGIYIIILLFKTRSFGLKEACGSYSHPSCQGTTYN